MSDREGSTPRNFGNGVSGMESIGAYLRKLREARKQSQEDLAEWSVLTGQRFDRSYVARQESGKLSGSVTRFLTYLSLIRASADTVSEMMRVAAQVPEGADQFSIKELLIRAQDAEGSGRFHEALGWALTAIQRGIESASTEDQAKGLIVAAIVLGNQGSWEMARSLAVEAMNLDSISTALRGRAAIRSAQAHLALGQVVSAEGALSSIDASRFESDPVLAALYWQEAGIIKRQKGDLFGALEAFGTAVEFYSLAESERDRARLLAVQARTALALSHRQDASRLVTEALELARSSGHAATIVRVMMHAGRIGAACGRPAEAREVLIAAEALAREIGNETLLFEIRLWLYEVARQIGERPLITLMRRRLQADRLKVVLEREEAEAFECFFASEEPQEEES